MHCNANVSDGPVPHEVTFDIAHRDLQEILRTQSIRNPLTGLFNRRHLEASLERELLRAARQSACALGRVPPRLATFRPDSGQILEHRG